MFSQFHRVTSSAKCIDIFFDIFAFDALIRPNTVCPDMSSVMAWMDLGMSKFFDTAFTIVKTLENTNVNIHET